MTERERDKTVSPPQAVERRRQPRPAPGPGDWEAIALSRVARRVETLAGGAQNEAGTELGWEARAVRNLRQRLKDPGQS